MAPLDSLPGDQRAVLQLVLARGRSYDAIAGMLSIDPHAVRERALAAADAIGPATGVAAPERQLICDYLLGQLPADGDVRARELLADSAAARTWTEGVRTELEAITSQPLPEIPHEREVAAPNTPAPVAATREPAPPRETARPSETSERPAPARARATSAAPRSRSRRGGLLSGAVVLAAIIAVVLVLVLHHHTGNVASARQSSTPATTPAETTPSVTSTSSVTTPRAGARPVAQITLTPTASGSDAAAIADVLRQGSQLELAIVGEHVPPNTSANSYEVWLYNSHSDAVSIGFVSPGVTADGKLSAAGPLPANAAHYRHLIVTTETSDAPSSPGSILLEGPVSGLS